MTPVLRVAGAQIDLTVGDLAGNERSIREAMAWAVDRRADVLLLPELAVTGYPPEDLLLRESFVDQNLVTLGRLAEVSADTSVVVGFVDRGHEADPRTGKARIMNAAAVLRSGRVQGVYHKVLLPNYGVFDEARYFTPGMDPATVWPIGDVSAGISVCEDIWSAAGPPASQTVAGASVLLNINGSPYHVGKPKERAELLRTAARRWQRPVVYVNTVGGQDELVFDGDSMVFAADGDLVYRAARFSEELFVVDVPLSAGEEEPAARTRDAPTTPDAPVEEEIYTALVTGLRDYVTKNAFTEVVIGLSGGIDSALTAAIAADAVGGDSVHCITMPTRYSSSGSVSDSVALAANLGCRFEEIRIDPLFGGFLEALAPLFAGTSTDTTEENLQARIRGTVLMAISNKFRGMVVATGNKSEMAVGYATLYGDMVGGFAVLKDVYKTLVYRLAEWRNRAGEVIPASIIEKEPSAELRPDQRDVDTLPPYDMLDAILERYIEADQAVDDIVAAGFDRTVVAGVARLVDQNEYKRRQAPPGVKITSKAFGKDRRLPITNHFLG